MVDRRSIIFSKLLDFAFSATFAAAAAAPGTPAVDAAIAAGLSPLPTPAGGAPVPGRAADAPLEGLGRGGFPAHGTGVLFSTGD